MIRNTFDLFLLVLIVGIIAHIVISHVRNAQARKAEERKRHELIEALKRFVPAQLLGVLWENYRSKEDGSVSLDPRERTLLERLYGAECIDRTIKVITVHECVFFIYVTDQFGDSVPEAYVAQFEEYHLLDIKPAPKQWQDMEKYKLPDYDDGISDY